MLRPREGYCYRYKNKPGASKRGKAELSKYCQIGGENADIYCDLGKGTNFYPYGGTPPSSQATEWKRALGSLETRWPRPRSPSRQHHSPKYFRRVIEMLFYITLCLKCCNDGTSLLSFNCLLQGLLTRWQTMLPRIPTCMTSSVREDPQWLTIWKNTSGTR